MTQDSYLIGLIGSGIGNSFSPRLHEREADLHGLRYLYRLIDLDRIGADPGRVGQLVGAARGMGFRGLNITHPCKQLVIECLDELTPQAEAVGAVNTVVFEGEGRSARAVGHNTDVTGFAASFDQELAHAPRERVVQLGAGGAGVATAHALLAHGIGHLAVVDPLTDRAVALAASLNRRFGTGRATASGPDGLPALTDRADGLVHATPTGTPAHPGLPLPADLLDPGLWVVDVVYQPLETELLRIARARGCVAFNGVGMVVFQAADAFQLFTGREPDRARMLAHVAELARSE
ncbi:shikimate dehydrogenase [Streptomyces sp. NBC_00696]|uniref:shikimate dehydrogenase n=1 Tax=Streptomyces sp. NBC_00696 TaxID=2903672 RepID=UPI002E33664B|nr:shikimate dehydrogenase [Streptomyces sp. NBC_00696]